MQVLDVLVVKIILIKQYVDSAWRASVTTQHVSSLIPPLEWTQICCIWAPFSRPVFFMFILLWIIVQGSCCHFPNSPPAVVHLLKHVPANSIMRPSGMILKPHCLWFHGARIFSSWFCSPCPIYAPIARQKNRTIPLEMLLLWGGMYSDE